MRRASEGDFLQGNASVVKPLSLYSTGDKQRIKHTTNALTMSSSTPSARSTYDGSRLAEVHALPLDTATSCEQGMGRGQRSRACQSQAHGKRGCRCCICRWTHPAQQSIGSWTVCQAAKLRRGSHCCKHYNWRCTHGHVLRRTAGAQEMGAYGTG